MRDEFCNYYVHPVETLRLYIEDPYGPTPNPSRWRALHYEWMDVSYPDPSQ